MKKVKYKGLDFIFIFSTAFISSLLPFLTSYSKLIGEPFDTRFQIVIHEHWFWFLKGDRPIRDVYIFYPFDTTLGFSDIFLANGFFYSLFRFLNFSILNAWTLTNITILCIGNIGFAFLLLHILKHKFMIILGLIALSNSYAFIAFLDIWPNTVGYVLVSWILFLLYKIYNSREIDFIRWLNALLIFLPILSLSFWYPGFFSIFGTILFVFFIFIGQKLVLLNWLRALKKKANIIKLAFGAPIWLALWGLFLFITLPTKGNLRRAPEEIYKGSLDIADFFSIDLVGPTVFNDVLKNFVNVEWAFGNQNWAVGFPLLTILTFLLVSFQSRRTIFRLNSLFSFTFFAILLSLLLTIRIKEFGLYIFLWQNFEILGIIRTPVRINILINFLILLFIFKFIDKKISISNIRKTAVYIVLVLVISLDQIRILTGRWDKESFIDKNLFSQKAEIQNNCSYFVLVNEGSGHWSDTIEGMLLSTLINVPTINGYSGTLPADAIKRNWDQPSARKYAVEYIERNKLDQTGCIIDNQSHYKVLTLSPILMTDLIGASEWEFSKKKYWLWFVENKSSFTVANPFDNHPIPTSKVLFTKASCLDNVVLEITQENTKSVLYLDSRNPELVFKLDEIPESGTVEIEINSSKSGCFIGEDPRPLIYSLEITK